MYKQGRHLLSKSLIGKSGMTSKIYRKAKRGVRGGCLTITRLTKGGLAYKKSYKKDTLIHVMSVLSLSEYETLEAKRSLFEVWNVFWVWLSRSSMAFLGLHW